MVDWRSLNKYHVAACLHFLFTHIVCFACSSLPVSLPLSPTHLSRLGSQVFAAGNVSFPQLLPKVAVLLNWKIFSFFNPYYGAFYYFSSHSNGIWCFLLVFIYFAYYELFQLYGDSNYMVMLKFTATIYWVLFCNKHSSRAFVNIVYCKYKLLCKVGWTVVFIFHYSCTHF